MKKVSYIVFTLLITLNCYSQTDKALHFSAGFVFSGISSLSKQKNEKIIIGVTSAFAIGVAKELYDKKRGGKVDYNDIWFTTAGGLVGSVIFTYVLKPKKIKYEKDKHINLHNRNFDYFVNNITNINSSGFN